MRETSTCVIATKPMVDMCSSIIVMRKIKERLHIVLRWRQLEDGRLRRCVDSIERLEILASHECMQCSCDMHNVNFDPDHDPQGGALWQTDQEDSTERSAEGSRSGACRFLIAFCGVSMIKLLTAGSRSTFGISFLRMSSRSKQAHACTWGSDSECQIN